MSERKFFKDEFDPSQLISPIRRLRPGVGTDPELRIHITFSSQFGKLVPSFALRGWRARFVLYKDNPGLTDEQLADKAEDLARRLRFGRNGSRG